MIMPLTSVLSDLPSIVSLLRVLTVFCHLGLSVFPFSKTSPELRLSHSLVVEGSYVKF